MKWFSASNKYWILFLLIVSMISLTVTFLFVGCRDSTLPPNAVLISIDTLRSDHLGAYGYPLGYTGTLDRLAWMGTINSNTKTSIPQTTPAHASLLTGLYPANHGSRHNAFAIHSEIPVLPELLSSQGYHTGGFVSHFLLAPARSGLDRGFQTYEFVDHQAEMAKKHKGGPFPLLSNLYLKADEVNNSAIPWIKNVLEPFFIFLHYYDCHKPYGPPAPFCFIEELPEYDRELAGIDRAIRKILSQIALSNRLSNTIIHVIADHGESLGEHNYTGHGHHLYFPSINIPWISIDFRQRPSQTIDTRLSIIIDLVPTLCSQMGFDLTWKPDGQDLESSEGSRVAFSESASTWNNEPGKRIFSVRDSRYTLISGPTSGKKELFLTSQDPGELHNLYEMEPEIRDQLLSELSIWLKFDTEGIEDPEENLDPHTIRALKALGYLDVP